MNHFLNITDHEQPELQEILDLSTKFQENPEPVLAGKNIVFAFEKPSLRTKIGTEAAINKLSGNVLHVDAETFFGKKVFTTTSSSIAPLPPGEAGRGENLEMREDLIDTIKNVSQWADAVFARVYSHDTLQFLKTHGNIPIVNALCDQHHPMQALADLKTIQDTIGKQKTSIAFIGDANNVAYSLIEICLKFGHDVRFAGPSEYFWKNEILDYFQDLAQKNSAKFIATNNAKIAAKNAKFIYADTFVSMGEEDLYEEKTAIFSPYQVNTALMQHTDNGYFMHCLPAHRGIEVTDSIMDHKNSLIYPLAKNRMITSLGLFSKII